MLTVAVSFDEIKFNSVFVEVKCHTKSAEEILKDE